MTSTRIRLMSLLKVMLAAFLLMSGVASTAAEIRCVPSGSGWVQALQVDQQTEGVAAERGSSRDDSQIPSSSSTSCGFCCGCPYVATPPAQDLCTSYSGARQMYARVNDQPLARIDPHGSKPPPRA